MKHINLALMFLAVIAVVLFSSAWLFNHVNSWLGIAVFIVGLYALIAWAVSIFNKYTKGNSNEKA
jgi:type IV secretory pathway VirB2 component (pilin)